MKEMKYEKDENGNPTILYMRMKLPLMSERETIAHMSEIDYSEGPHAGKSLSL